MTDMADIFAARAEYYRRLFRDGQLTPKQYATLLSGLPYTPAKPQADETFESLADITQRVVKGLK